MKKIIEIKFGSHLYGTDTPESDLDLKSVYIPEARDILLGRVKGSICNKRPKKEGEKNFAGEVDEEIYSLQRYLQLLADGQTVALDMLFSTPDSWVNTNELHMLAWEAIRNNKHRLISKKSAAFIGYCKTQANKYGIKGSRVAAVRVALGLVVDEMPQATLAFIWDDIIAITEQNEHIEITDIEQPGGNMLPHWEVCGRKFSQTTTVKQVTLCLQKIMDNYGKRALAAEAQNGVDWKALSHAVRVANQAIELFQTGNVTFPLPNAKHILDIKTGKILYQDVANEIEDLLEKVEYEASVSKLPDSPDYEWIDEFVCSIYSNVFIY